MPTRRLNISFSRCVGQGLFSIALVALLFVTSSLHARPGDMPVEGPRAADEIELQQALLDLTNVWTVMCVAAHPDDEDGATLTVLRRKYGVHTVSLFSTFGEGGQNAIGPELYEELGAIRAQETLRAAEIQGSEPHFLGLKDFGFSKSADEAFRVWGHDEALRRMVSQIRRLRPDVIITNHDTTNGHGHHQATGCLVLEAFDAAANSELFPEPGVKEWQVQRLFVRVSNETRSSDKSMKDETERSSNVITIDRNERDPVRGSTYAEQALKALQQHATQGPWPQRLPKDGWPPVRYRLVREAAHTPPLPVNAATFLDGMKSPEYLKRKLTLPTIDNRPLVDFIDQPERVFKAIASNRIKVVPFDEAAEANKYRLTQVMDSKTDDALAAASGISATLIPREKVIVPGKPTTFVLSISNRGRMNATIESAFVGGAHLEWRLEKALKLKPLSTLTEEIEILPNEKTPINLPNASHLYDERLFGEEFEALLKLEINGANFYVSAETRVDVAPAVEVVSMTPSPFVFTPVNRNQPLTLKMRLVNHQDKPFKGQFEIASKVTQIRTNGEDIELASNETRDFTIRTDLISVGTPTEGRSYRAAFDSIIISVRPLNSPTVISRQETRVVYSDARVTPGLRVGYVRSFDDTLRNSLAALGVESQELSIDDIRTGDLQKFNTIIIDNRGYQAHPELVALNSRLLEFAKNGGTLIVFYHKSNEWNADPAKNRPSLAPFPIVLGDERVTDESAPVTFTDAEHLLLNAPNTITAEDFAGWIQERGLYYPKTWDPRYSAPLAMSDSGEEPLRGGLLALDYEKGHYIYTSMVWYRQLREGLPGAYRMFANMISYPGRRVVSGVLNH